MSHAARRFDAQFVVSTGDNFYEHGVTGVQDAHWTDSFDAVYDGPALDVPWYGTLGNHDYHGAVDAQVDRTEQDARWTLPDRYYSVRHAVGASASVQLVVLDTTPFVGSYGDPAAGEYIPAATEQDTVLQRYWLRHMLGPSTATWKIVVGHHPIWSGGTVHGGTAELQRYVDPILRKQGAHLYLSGHEHDLQHLFTTAPAPPSGGDGASPDRIWQNGAWRKKTPVAEPQARAAPSASAPLHYVVSGAGSEARPTGTSAATRFQRAVPGFAVVTLTAKQMRLRFCDAAGAVLYDARVAHPAGPVAAQVAAEA